MLVKPFCRSHFCKLTSSLNTFIGEEQNKEALQDVEDENQWDTKGQQENPSLTTLPLPHKNPQCHSENHQIWLLHWVSEFRFLPCWVSLFLFFLHSLKVLKGKSEFLWILLVPAFRFFKTLTGLRKGSFSITVLSLASWGEIALRCGCYTWRPLDV